MVVKKISFVFIVFAFIIIGLTIYPALADEFVDKKAAAIEKYKAELAAKAAGTKVEEEAEVAEIETETVESTVEEKVTDIKEQATEKAEEVKSGIETQAAEIKEEVAEKVLAVDDSEAIPPANTGGALATVSTQKHLSTKGVTSDLNIGVYYQKEGNLVKAIEAYEKVLSVDPDNAEAHNNLGIIYKEQGNIDKAIEHFQRVVSLNPGMDEAHNNLGVMYYINKDQRNAVIEYRKALEINPHNVTSQINLGLVYKAQGLERQSIDIIEEVLTVEPFNLEAHYNLGILYEGLGHFEKAVWHYSRFQDNVGKSYPVLAKKVSERINELEVMSGEILGSREVKVLEIMEK